MNSKLGFILVFVASLDVWLQLATIHCRVTQTSVVAFHVKLCTYATLLSRGTSLLHFLPHLQVFLNACSNPEQSQHRFMQ